QARLPAGSSVCPMRPPGPTAVSLRPGTAGSDAVEIALSGLSPILLLVGVRIVRKTLRSDLRMSRNSVHAQPESAFIRVHPRPLFLGFLLAVVKSIGTRMNADK